MIKNTSYWHKIEKEARETIEKTQKTYQLFCNHVGPKRNDTEEQSAKRVLLITAIKETQRIYGPILRKAIRKNQINQWRKWRQKTLAQLEVCNKQGQCWLGHAMQASQLDCPIIKAKNLHGVRYVGVIEVYAKDEEHARKILNEWAIKVKNNDINADDLIVSPIPLVPNDCKPKSLSRTILTKLAQSLTLN